MVFSMRAALALLYAAVLALNWTTVAGGEPAEPAAMEVTGRVPSGDGVEIAYTARGAGDTALVFIHGGLADRTFWSPQVMRLADRFQVIALDLAGHGESGRDRGAWVMAAWADDVRAVVDALGLERVVLIGNSLGGPVALEAAPLLPGRVLGVIGVDTLNDAHQRITPEQAHARAEAFRTDFAGTCKAMVAMLFHAGTQAELHGWAEERMCRADRGIAVGMMEGWGGYDLEAVFRRAGVPIRAINGDLWPTLVERNREVAPDFDVKIMKGAGHYPMLEHPEEFNRLLIETVESLLAPAAPAPPAEQRTPTTPRRSSGLSPTP